MKKIQIILYLEKTFESFKFLKDSLRKSEKCLSVSYIPINLTKPVWPFCAFGRKMQGLGNDDKILKDSFQKTA